MLLGHWVELEWLEPMEMRTRTTRIGSLVTPAFPVVPVALAACHLADGANRPTSLAAYEECPSGNNCCATHTLLKCPLPLTNRNDTIGKGNSAVTTMC